MQRQNATDLAAAIAEFEEKLPDWWWSVGSCSVSRDASCGPDLKGRDADLLDDPEFGNGFHHDGDEDVPASLRLLMEWALHRRDVKRSAQTKTPAQR